MSFSEQKLRLAWLPSTVPGLETHASDVALAGDEAEICGWLYCHAEDDPTDPVCRAASWRGRTPRVLAPLETYRQSFARRSFPKRRIVVGASKESPLHDEMWVQRGTVWVNGEPYEQSPLAGHFSSLVADLAQDANVYVGDSHPSIDTAPTVPGSAQPVFWPGLEADPYELGVPSDFGYGKAEAVSPDAKLIGGCVGIADRVTRPCVWHKNIPHVLDIGEGGCVHTITPDYAVFGSCVWELAGRGCFRSWVMQLDLEKADLGISEAKPVFIPPDLPQVGAMPVMGRAGPYLVGSTERRVTSPGQDQVSLLRLAALGEGFAPQGDPLELGKHLGAEGLEEISAVFGLHAAGNGVQGGVKQGFHVCPA